MQNKKLNPPQSIYVEHLRIINGVRLTKREIDIIAFFTCGRSAKKIAAFFLISPKTVENHTHNIMLKLDCNSRESIIDFIEKSGKLPVLRRYYITVLAQAAFDKCLKNISKLNMEEKFPCVIISYQEQSSQNFLIYYLEASLKFAGLKVATAIKNDSQPIPEVCNGNYVVSIIIMEKNDQAIKNDEAFSPSNGKSRVLLFLPEGENPIENFEVLDGADSLSHEDQKNYYLLVFKILKRLLSYHNLDKIISEFKEQYEAIERLIESKDYQSSLQEKENNFDHKTRPILQYKKWSLITALLMMSGFIIGILEFRENEEEEHAQHHKQTDYKIRKKKEISSIRSDLNIPTESSLLSRFELIDEIDERFKGEGGIQAIALTGIGGAGKTTLARHYASLQRTPVTWEINAETKETLNGSFENLAQVLSRTVEDQKLLSEILKTKLSKEREVKVILFVKERLKLLSNWFLIYDNVERFTDIQNHFPKDSGGWGQGRIILTTQDNNIENNKHVSSVILIKELTSAQKLSLFLKIISNGGVVSFTAAQRDEAKKFLVDIPPFPLDISVAAYYLKATNVSYKNYLENMLKYNKDFSNIQEKILQEAGDYTKTRYGIITLSLKNLIDTNSDFKDLFLFISLLDSQNIPRYLLTNCKDNFAVDNFIHNLKKFSLITNEVPAPHHFDSFFSIHRSTQSIILAYLKKTLTLEKNKRAVQPIASLLENCMADAVDKEDFAKMKILYRHAEQFLIHDDLLNDDMRGSISGRLGCIYYYLRHSIKAKQLLKDSLLKLEKNYNENHNKIAHFLVYLGNVYRRLGDYGKAKELFEKSLIIHKKCSEHPVGMARACGYLGIVYKDLGDFKQAKTLLEQSLIIHKKYPKNCIGLAWSLAHLGDVYKVLGDYQKAKELFEQSLTIYKTYSKNHVGAAWVCGNLGDVYIKLGNYKKAKGLLEESLTICNEHFFEDHIYVAQALVHLGIFYREKGNYKKARELLEKGLIAFERTYGKDHIETGFVLKNLGQTYFLEGKLEIAECVMRKTLDIFHKNKHPDKYMALENLAEIYIKKSKNAQNLGNIPQSKHFKLQAISYQKKALEVIKIHFPENSPHIIRIQSNIRVFENGK